ncbi:hypothetical protein PISMIDRAFT_449455 [Pisolithus microcarpus 441]|uniref:Uncharacterized protein n=1 Tax=Pisolithus microcarpus 441 TaxID=765257 RepID=A0A0C9Z3F1_9AGAM|nr:hypothetical protein PISMIDRAFT_449455 [Pisolithus microcarpus 441]
MLPCSNNGEGLPVETHTSCFLKDKVANCFTSTARTGRVFIELDADVDAVAGWLGSYGGENLPLGVCRVLGTFPCLRSHAVKPLRRTRGVCGRGGSESVIEVSQEILSPRRGFIIPGLLTSCGTLKYRQAALKSHEM